jgi:hypothetical protein
MRIAYRSLLERPAGAGKRFNAFRLGNEAVLIELSHESYDVRA